MAYMNQEKKAALAPKIKAVLKKYKMKGTLGVCNNMTLVINVSSGELDIIGNRVEQIQKSMVRNETNRSEAIKCLQESKHIQVNVYHIENTFSGEVSDFLQELYAAAMQGNHNNSDIMTDYFDVGWYVDINIGKWNKPYALVK